MMPFYQNPIVLMIVGILAVTYIPSDLGKFIFCAALVAYDFFFCPIYLHKPDGTGEWVKPAAPWRSK
jgi:hypothetical protein